LLAGLRVTLLAGLRVTLLPFAVTAAELRDGFPNFLCGQSTSRVSALLLLLNPANKSNTYKTSVKRLFEPQIAVEIIVPIF